MPESKDTVGRALELAESGEYSSVNHIRQQLRREDRDDVYIQLRGAKINQQLMEILRKAALGKRHAAPTLI